MSLKSKSKDFTVIFFSTKNFDGGRKPSICIFSIKSESLRYSITCLQVFGHPLFNVSSEYILIISIDRLSLRGKMVCQIVMCQLSAAKKADQTCAQ